MQPIQSLSILKQSEWEALFPKEEYGKNKQVVLLFLIALGQPNEKIKNYIKGNPKKINFLSEEYPLTSLHVATMKNNPEIVQSLLDAQANPNIQDEFGWSPLHHAALVSNEIFNLLIQQKADPSLTTQLNCTYKDLQTFAQLTPPIVDKRVIYLQKAVEGNENNEVMEEVSPEEIMKLAHLTQYTDVCVYAKSQLELLWRSYEQEYDNDLMDRSEPWQRFLKIQYDQMKQRPPSLIIRENGQMGLGLLAGEVIKTGQAIIEYTGEIIAISPELLGSHKNIQDVLRLQRENEYSVREIDAKNKGNVSRFINDGFPNVDLRDLFNEKGFETRPIFIAVDEIGIKDPIFWDYGNNYMGLKWGFQGPYMISQKEEIKLFINKNAITKYINEIEKWWKKASTHGFQPESYPQVAKIENRLHYFINTPIVMIYLTCLKKVNVAQWRTLQKSEVIEMTKPNQLHLIWLDTLFEILEKFEKKLAQLDKQTDLKIRSFFENSCDILSVLQVVYGINSINLLKNEEVPQFNLDNLQLSLIDYRWEEDPNFPFLKEGPKFEKIFFIEEEKE